MMDSTNAVMESLEKTFQDYYIAQTLYYRYRGHFIQLAKSGSMNLPENLATIRQRLSMQQLQLEEDLDKISNSLVLAKGMLLMKKMALNDNAKAFVNVSEKDDPSYIMDVDSREESLEPPKSGDFSHITSNSVLGDEPSPGDSQEVVLESFMNDNAIGNFDFNFDALAGASNDTSADGGGDPFSLNSTDALFQFSEANSLEKQLELREQQDRDLAPTFDSLEGFEDLI